MSKPQFTFKNYLKEIKKCWLLVAIFVVLGAAGGAAYSFMKPTTYVASAKVSVYKSTANTGTVTSPYVQIGELLQSSELVDGDLESYEVTENVFGVFSIVATSADTQKAIDTANKVMDSTEKVIMTAYEDYCDYQITVLERASEAVPTIEMKNRIVSAAVITVAAFIAALVVIFIRFDYIAEK